MPNFICRNADFSLSLCRRLINVFSCSCFSNLRNKLVEKMRWSHNFIFDIIHAERSLARAHGPLPMHDRFRAFGDYRFFSKFTMFEYKLTY